MKFVQNIFYSKYSVVFRKLLVKKCINDNKSKLLFCFKQGKWIVEGVHCTKKIQVLLCSIPRKRNNKVCGYVNLKNNIEEFQGSGVPFPLESLYT